MHTHPDVNSAFEELTLLRRKRRMFLISIGAGGSGIAILAAVSAALTWRSSSLGWISLLAWPVGGIAGLAHAPILCTTVAGRKWSLALPAVYLPALALGVALLTQRQLLAAFIVFECAVPAAAVLALALPRHRIDSDGTCILCGYNLAASGSVVCPECGAPAAASGAPVRQPEPAGKA